MPFDRARERRRRPFLFRALSVREERLCLRQSPFVGSRGTQLLDRDPVVSGSRLLLERPHFERVCAAHLRDGHERWRPRDASSGVDVREHRAVRPRQRDDDVDAPSLYRQTQVRAGRQRDLVAVVLAGRERAADGLPQLERRHRRRRAHGPRRRQAHQQGEGRRGDLHGKPPGERGPSLHPKPTATSARAAVPSGRISSRTPRAPTAAGPAREKL